MPVSKLVRAELARHDWPRLQCGCGQDAGHVPRIFERILCAEDGDEATGSTLTGHLERETNLFEAAVPATSVILAALAGELSADPRDQLMIMLWYLAGGDSHYSAAERGRGSLGDECRARIREGLWTVLHYAVNCHDEVAIDIAEFVDLDEGRHGHFRSWHEKRRRQLRACGYRQSDGSCRPVPVAGILNLTELAARRQQRQGVHVSYELRALAGQHELMARAASEAGADAVRLPQGIGLLPVTDDVFDRLGGGDVQPFGDVFWFLSGGVDALARRVSLAGPVAYLEADVFGGAGTQAMVLWRSGTVGLGPVVTKLRTPPSTREWAFNQALRQLGVERRDALDEFEALGLGRRRHTDDWTASGPG